MLLKYNTHTASLSTGNLSSTPSILPRQDLKETYMIDRSTYVNALMDALPDVIRDADLASQIVDIVFSVPMRALENGNEVELPGLGAISIDRSRGAGCLSYSSTSAHMQCSVQ